MNWSEIVDGKPKVVTLQFMISTNMTTEDKIRIGLLLVAVAAPLLASVLGFSISPLDEIGGSVH
jgi:hypothetical protein